MVEKKIIDEKKKSKAHEVKSKEVKNLSDKIKNSKTLMIISIDGVPSKQFQDIKKTIRSDVFVRVAKKNILNRTIKDVGKESILKLNEFIKDNSAFAISDKEGFELAGVLSKNKTPVFAKTGQTAPSDIEVKDGPTDLLPGPAISELGALGIQIAVEDGKISIKQSKVVVKEGQEIKEEVASLLQKLNIQPFEIGLRPIAIYDVESEELFSNINIDPEEFKSQMKEAASKALGFAQKIVYYCKDTIGYLLAKANADGEALGKLVPKEKAENKVDADSSQSDTQEGTSDGEEKVADSEEKSEESEEADKENKESEESKKTTDNKNEEAIENKENVKEKTDTKLNPEEEK
jgi:large subunit ribosomal protein L10